MAIVEFEPRQEHSVRETLEDAASQEFDSVIVFGFRDGQINIKSSDCPDVLRVIGALDRAKSHLWEAP